MKPLTLHDIDSIEAYMTERDTIRKHIIALKKVRRVTLGPRVSLVFENRDTVKFQIQEMCRIERITEPSLVQQEIDVYNDLLPAGRKIGATLLIELVQEDDMPKILKDLSGLEETIRLRFGDKVIAGVAEAGRSTDEKTSSVHYLTFPFSDDDARLMAETERVELLSEHPNYSYETVLDSQTVASLVRDLLQV